MGKCWLSPRLDSASSLTITHYTGAELEAELQRSEAGFLVINEIYYPAGWKAFLNGEEVPIHRTNYFLRGIQIPPGEHTLTLDFRPDSFTRGIQLSWMALALQLLIGLWVGINWFRTKS